MISSFPSAVVDDANITGPGSDSAATRIERACALLFAQHDGTLSSPTGDSGNLAHRGLASWQLRLVTAHIHANLDGKVTVADMAGAARSSVSHFTRAFRASFGESPLAYVKGRRLERALEMMMRTREPLSQIAIACGFCDQAHFSRNFHRRFGLAPRALRNQALVQGELQS